MRRPTFYYERKLAAGGFFVIGVDEAGCGCLAGPVVAAAVHLPLDSRIAEIADSKLLKPEKREKILARFLEMGLRWSVGAATAREIDRHNIRRATYLAMRRAIQSFQTGMKGKNIFALVDAWTLPDITIPQRGVIHGDRYIKSIAAASIIAKVARDRLMREYDRDFPGYGLAVHKGYATELHRARLKKLGPTPIHRKSFTVAL